MVIMRRMEWPEPRNLTSIEGLSEFCTLLYQTLTEESALRTAEIDLPYTDRYNVFLGHEAGLNNTVDIDATEGIYNIFIGHQAGYANVTGSGGIFIGYQAGYNETTDNKLYIDNSDTTTPLIYGDFANDFITINGDLRIASNKELRFYDNGNYVGYEAPALSADCIWILPTADGANGEHMVTDGSKTLSWTTGAGTGNVIASGDFGTDNVILRSDGVGKGCQHTGITIDNSDNVLGMGAIEIQNQVDGTSAKGIRMWDMADSNWGIYMSQSGAGKSLADGVACTNFVGDTLHHIRFRCHSNAGNGFIWENLAETCLMDLEGDTGNLTVLGKVGIGSSPGTNKVSIAQYDTATSLRITGTSSALAKAAISIGGYGELSIDAPGVGGGRFLLDDAGNLTLGSATSTITGGTKLNIEAGATGIHSGTIYADTAALAGNMHISAAYKIYRDTSARKYKDKIKDLELDSSLIYNLRPVSFNSMANREKDDPKLSKQRFHGFIADEIEQYYPDLIDYNDDHEPENYDSRMLMTLMLAEIQKHETRIEALEAGA